MNQNLKKITDFLQQNEYISAQEKTALAKAVMDTESEMAITAFKLDRTEKVKRTTAILLEETIEELEHKRKAVEAQNRELEIESSLERVRTVAMGMRKPDDLLSICGILFGELRNMGLDELRNTMINIHNDEKGSFLNYDFSEMAGATVTNILYSSHPATESLVMQIRKSEDAFAEIVIDGSELDEWREYRKSMGEQDDPKLNNIPQLSYYFFSIGTGAIGISTYRSITEEKRNVLKRFRNVFELAYRRYIDVIQAEAQAREARIELALERVRARTMAMQKSDELREAVLVLYEQLQQLNFEAHACNIIIFNKETGDMQFWVSGFSQDIYPESYHIPRLNHPYHEDQLTAWREGEKYVLYEYSGQEKLDFDKIFFTQTDFRNVPDQPKAFMMGLKSVKLSTAFFSYGSLQVLGQEALAEDKAMILQRFATVFDQTYTRFLDLQKAEAQAREAIIESALERVRSKTMAMHNSQDVGDTVSTMIDELDKLGVETNRCGILIYSDMMTAEVWTAKSNPEGKATFTMGQLDLAVHPLLSGIYQAWKNKEPLFTYTMVSEDLIAYYKAINETKYYPTSFDLNTLPSKEFHSDFYFAEGSIFAFTAEPIPAVATMIFKRFAGVFGQTYRRYLDLQKSEANAIEAIRRSSLDRVRAETASMRTTDDLERITPLIWNELTTLGVPFIRCGVFIMDQQLEQIHTFLSTPDGRAIAAFHLTYDTAQTTFQNLVEYWQKKQIYKEHWDEAAFINWTRKLVKSGALAPTEKYVTGDHPTNLDLHFIPFLQGMLYVGNDKPLNDDELHLVQNLADAFSTAYARYEDFNKLESAKAQIEKTLVDLKQAQAQLVQSEKMASLGELTAGIAHEIQNPLNFVNNFSEVSNELIDEMKDELAAGNLQLAIEIADDVKQNLEKILSHGKRADAIVKGMLQHSRSSSGIKEPTDINALADEYLRLAYHGLRAKDKSFNATMKTDFDQTIGTINIIPQDIGRVILNLMTNAFYAVSQKMKVSDLDSSKSLQGHSNYDPTVSVTTKRTNNQVEVLIKDNGNGIPQNVLGKIFQPFFTTKPTGQGTGLGLSMSYDIIKAHGGELKVETIEGVQTEFTIKLNRF